MQKKLIIIAGIVGLSILSLNFKQGDLVLGKYNKRQYWYPAKIESISGKNVKLMYQGEGFYPPKDEAEDSTVDMVRAIDWKVGSKLQCKPAGGSYQPSDVLKINGDQLHIKFTVEVEPPEQDVNINDCMEEQVVPAGKEWTLNGIFRDFEKYTKINTMPSSEMKDLEDSVTGTLDYEMKTWDGAQYVKILKCAATSGFEKLSLGGQHSGRYAKSACALQLEEGKCMIIYGGCQQEYLGNNQYGSCAYRTLYEKASNQIDCKNVK